MSLYSNPHNLSPTQEYKKIFCAYHRTEFLTNFCAQKQCLMPMCPSCVAEHTEYHNKSSHRPTYINLQEALQQVRQKCYTMIVNLQDTQRKNDEIINHIEDLPQHLHEQLTTCKESIFEHIQSLFQQYESQVLKDIERKYQEGRVYNGQESEQIRNTILGCIDELYDKIGVLKGDQCLAGLITYYGEDQRSYQDTVTDIEQYLNRHKKTGKVHINLNQNILYSHLEGLCFKVLVPTMLVENSHGYEPLKENSMRRNPQKSTSRVNIPRGSDIPINNSMPRNLSVSFNNKMGSRANYSLGPY